MMEYITSPVTVFLAALVVSVILYVIAGRFSARPAKPKPDKYESYACGQKVIAERVPVVIWVFRFAVAFMVIDVVSFIFMLSLDYPFITPVTQIVLLYVTLIAIALMAIFRRW